MDSSLSPNFSDGASGVSGFTSGRTSAEAGERSDSPNSFVAVTWKWYVVLLVRPLSVQVLAGQSWRNPPSPYTVYVVIGEPRSAGAVQFSSAVRSPTLCACGVVGASGLSFTVSLMRAVAYRDESSVLSPTVYDTIRVPENPADGVTVTESPLMAAEPWPVSVATPMIFSGVSGNGLASFASTLTVTGFPAAALSSTSSLAT